MTNLLYDCYRVLYSVYGGGSYLKQALTEVDTDPKNRAAVAKICYGVLDNDAFISHVIAANVDKNPKLPARIVLKISIYAIKFLNKKPYAVVGGAVDLMKKMGKGGAAGFVNAALRKIAANPLPTLPQDVVKRLSVGYSYPEFAVKLLIDKYGAQRTERIIAAEGGLTTLCFYDTDGGEYLKNVGAEFEKTPFENVFTLRRFTRNADYDAGIYTYQALPSVAICEAVKGGESLLDCCAAPGGKSIRLSKKFESVTSWDIHPHRVRLIESYAARMGVKNITTAVRDAKVYDSGLDKAFDAVLCDAPCTGMGVVKDDPDIKLRRTQADLNSLTCEQRGILDAVSNYVKPGGILYYSTCSVLPQENEDVAKDFLQRHNDFVGYALTSKLPHEQNEGMLTFLPDISGGLGFFMAAFKRVL